MEIKKIGSRNYMATCQLPGWDLNLHFILGNQRNYVIDTGLGAESMAPVKAFLADSDKPTVVVNTHHHWDHIWGNHCFPGSPILAHRLCRELTIKYWDIMLEENRQLAAGEVQCRLPDLVFDSELYFPEDGIRLLYTPGHSTDGISVFDEVDRVLNAGDNIGDTMEEIVPYLTTDAPTYLETIQKYKSLGALSCISGHNAVLGPDVFDRILAALDAG